MNFSCKEDMVSSILTGSSKLYNKIMENILVCDFYENPDNKTYTGISVLINRKEGIKFRVHNNHLTEETLQEFILNHCIKPVLPIADSCAITYENNNKLNCFLLKPYREFVLSKIYNGSKYYGIPVVKHMIEKYDNFIYRKLCDFSEGSIEKDCIILGLNVLNI